MSKFRKKPVVIEAFKWEGYPNPSTPRWFVQAMSAGMVGFKTGDTSLCCPALIETLEGIMTADIGDWIIQGIKGEIYPCKPDIFTATYEPAE